MPAKCRMHGCRLCRPNRHSRAVRFVSFGIQCVNELCQTAPFRKWLRRIPDSVTKARLLRRIERLAAGNKSSQERDIILARAMIESLENDE
jgi:putative component of toxin-antitoxin plasmid stabilization module